MIAPSPTIAARLNAFEPSTTPRPTSRSPRRIAATEDASSGASAAIAVRTPSSASVKPSLTPTRSSRSANTAAATSVTPRARRKPSAAGRREARAWEVHADQSSRHPAGKPSRDGSSRPRVLGSPAADDQVGDEPRPAGLVRRAEAGAGVAVEVLVERDQVVPGRVALEQLVAAEDRPPPVRALEEDPGQPRRRARRRPARATARGPSRSGTRP